MSVMVQENWSSSPDAKNSSAEANARTSCQRDRTSPASAARIEGSSSTIEIKCPAAIAQFLSSPPLTELPSGDARSPKTFRSSCLSMGFAFKGVRHANQIGKGTGPHLSHGSATVDFYGYLAQSKVGRDLLVHLAGSHQR